ncbi:hypothetical protein [Clostridium puniceum]|uniref:hypothetical protein n=1 Tax=Clostridium puniceum TaxID=29367 RepID=UPI00098C6F50|nr:hypothetical protein [Clostridium puniceum]
MENKETCKEKCEFTVHPCNFKVQIKEIKPFYVCACKSIVLDLKIVNYYNTNSLIKIKSRPRYGKLYLLNASTLIYKSTKRFSGLDLFQILIEDEYGGKHTETILIRVIKK